jgi:hypothetical protein
LTLLSNIGFHIMKLYYIVTTKDNEGLSKGDKEYVSGLYNKTKIEKNHTMKVGSEYLKVKEERDIFT